jgi:hypothetical protein
MFKKSLVALALVTASTGAFAAADIKTGSEANAIDFSIEGSASKAEILAGDVEVVLGAEYSIGDILTFTFVGGDLDVATAPSTFTTSTGNAAVTIGLLSSTTGSLTYRITEIDTTGGVTTVAEEIVLTGLEFDRDSVVAGSSVVVTYAAETSTGVTIDASATTSSATIITASNQFSIAASPTEFDAVVDVEAQRLTFEAAATADAASFTTVNDGALTYPATAVTMDIVLNGNFSFLDEDANTAGIQITGGTIVPAPTTITDTEITWDAVAVGAHAITIETANKPAGTVIPTQDYTFDVVADYTDHGTAEVAGTAAAAGMTTVASGSDLGEWVLNGSVVEVPYLPMGPNTQPFLRHTNDGSQTGDITLRYMVEGVHTAYTDSVTLVEQAAPGVRNLLSEIEAALLADGYDRSAAGFKVALEITSNVPADDVKVTVGAKFSNQENTDRLSIGVIESND